PRLARPLHGAVLMQLHDHSTSAPVLMSPGSYCSLTCVRFDAE
ncbi:hypothetical protein HMPREF9552_01333, partial [Escherichia coli MS 198-1]